MKTSALILTIALSSIFLFTLPAAAQDESKINTAAEPVMVGPNDSKGSQPMGVTGEYFNAANGASEKYVYLSWGVHQQCLFGTYLAITLYRNDAVIFSYTYAKTSYGNGWDHGYYDYVGPAKSYTYKLVRHCTGTLCNEYWRPTRTGSTLPVQPPRNLSVTNLTNSDRYINLKWSKGSELGYAFVVYDDGNPIATTYDTTYTVSTTPGNSSRWGVATQSSYGLSARVESLAATSTFKRPEQFHASTDTTVGYVRLGWECSSDFATHYQIYRDDAILATLPVVQKDYLDYAAIPGQKYKYQARSYNTGGTFSANSDSSFGRAVFLNASDGEEQYRGYVYVYWTDFPAGYEDGMKLYRDGVEVKPIIVNQVEKQDPGAIPGKVHNYKLEVLQGTTVVLTVEDFGFTPPNGSVQGTVTTPTGSGGVKNVEMRAYATSEHLSKAVSLDGIDDFVSTPPLHLNSNTVTLSGWIKRNGVQNDGTGIMISRAGSTTAGLYLMSTGELHYNWNDQPATYNWSSGLIVPNNEWTFVAVVIEPDKATLYLNDSSAVNPVSHAIEEFDGILEVGRDVGFPSGYFKGLIDEVAVWKTARAAEQLMLDRHHILSGTENGLVAYWRFNQTASGVAGDYAVLGNHHGTLYGAPEWVDDTPSLWHYGMTLANGSYTIPRINWEENVEFTVRPSKEGHGFRGSNFPQDSLVLPFTEVGHAHEGVNFVDTTAIEISGTVLVKSVPPCPLEGAKILINGKLTDEYTDSAGNFSLSVSEAGKYTVSAEYQNHKFMPSDMLLEVQDPVTGLIFLDTMVTALTGKVSGGCDNFLGVASIRMRSMGGACIDTTILTDPAGAFSVSMPALWYVVQLNHIDNADSLTILNYFSADTIDMSQHDTSHSWVYHSPPIIRISELPAAGCGGYTVPIMVQERGYPVKINVSERYGDLECPVRSGNVTFYDHVAYSSRDTTIVLENGSTYYPLYPGYPNLTGGGAHPYQKMLVVRALVGKYTSYDTLWVVVVGQKPRDFQFSTVSPELPLMILRDPPGDQSYSYISTSTTSSVNIGFSVEMEAGVRVFAKAKVGGGANIPFLGNVGVWAAAGVEAKAGLRNTIEGTQEIKISTTDILKTSDADVITGGEGDLYMGAALNLVYGITDILEYDTGSCSIVPDTGLVWNGNGFKTTYLYTESHIRNSVIPGLQNLAAILNASGEKIKQDSAKVLLNQAAVWQQILEYNATIKLHAQPLPEFPGNISFSAGANRHMEASTTSSGSLSIGFNLYVEGSVALSAGLKSGDFNEAEAGVEVFAKLNVGVSAKAGYEVTNTIGFELADDDANAPGDAFTVDILGDSVYGTPVFNLVSGTSSCPWEHPTLPREGVGLSMNTYVQHNVAPEGVAAFDLYLYNLGQNNETRGYLLSLVQGSNPDGAIISVGGAVLGDDQLSFSLEPGLSIPQRATLRVQREAGSLYDYENLKVHLYSPCDPRFDTTVSFSVHFIKPCSDVRIARPPVNWIVNGSSGRQLDIVLKDYDTSNHDMQELKFEYQLRGANEWTQLFNYSRTLLPADSVLYHWNMSALADGAYELRASTHCTIGTYYTRTHAGVYDCTPPAIHGTPEPADGSLDVGDTIRVAFSEGIDCATATTAGVTMRNITRGVDVAIQILCQGGGLVITPVKEGDLHQWDTVKVVLSSLADPYGNAIAEPMSWQFVVHRNPDGVDDMAHKLPREFSLEQNYPNPFNPEMKIRFGIPKTVDVLLVIYNILGQEIARLVDGRMGPGYYDIPFDGSRLGSGIYLYRLSAGDFNAVKKMVLVR
jgi:concanavalin A-like lectin/glucanase superfamily protein/Big-like domain-containing protein